MKNGDRPRKSPSALTGREKWAQMLVQSYARASTRGKIPPGTEFSDFCKFERQEDVEAFYKAWQTGSDKIAHVSTKPEPEDPGPRAA